LVSSDGRRGKSVLNQSRTLDGSALGARLNGTQASGRRLLEAPHRGRRTSGTSAPRSPSPRDSHIRHFEVKSFGRRAGVRRRSRGRRIDPDGRAETGNSRLVWSHVPTNSFRRPLKGSSQLGRVGAKNDKAGYPGRGVDTLMRPRLGVFAQKWKSRRDGDPI
jgi:hypothetical protein